MLSLDQKQQLRDLHQLARNSAKFVLEKRLHKELYFWDPELEKKIRDPLWDELTNIGYMLIADQLENPNGNYQTIIDWIVSRLHHEIFDAHKMDTLVEHSVTPHANRQRRYAMKKFLQNNKTLHDPREPGQCDNLPPQPEYRKRCSLESHVENEDRTCNGKVDRKANCGTYGGTLTSRNEYVDEQLDGRLEALFLSDEQDEEKQQNYYLWMYIFFAEDQLERKILKALRTGDYFRGEDINYTKLGKALGIDRRTASRRTKALIKRIKKYREEQSRRNCSR